MNNGIDGTGTGRDKSSSSKDHNASHGVSVEDEMKEESQHGGTASSNISVSSRSSFPSLADSRNLGYTSHSAPRARPNVATTQSNSLLAQQMMDTKQSSPIQGAQQHVDRISNVQTTESIQKFQEDEGVAKESSYKEDYPTQQQQEPSKFPAMAPESVPATDTPQEDEMNTKKHVQQDADEGLSSNSNEDGGQQRDAIHAGYDETASQVRNTPASQSSSQQANQDSADTTTSATDVVQQASFPVSTLEPVYFPASPGAYAIDGFNARNAARQSSEDQDSTPSTPPPPGITMSSEQDEAAQDRTVVADAVTTDDLEDRMRSRLINEAVSAEVVSATRKPFWKRRSVRIGFGVLILAAIGGIFVGVFASRGNGGSPTETPPTSFPTFDAFRPTLAPTVDPVIVSTIDLVERNSFDRGLALKNSSSPQYKALNWLLYNNTDLKAYSNKTKLQRFVLAALFYSTNGTGWKNSDGWLSDNDECLWWHFDYARTPPCSDGELSTLDLYNNNLVGTVPPEVALLGASLVRLYLNVNSLSGSIPTEIGIMTTLEQLSMDRNDLSSSIPSEFGLMTSLKRVILEDNNLDGSIPTEIGQLSNSLEWLSLDDNDLTGTIPSKIGRATGFRLLDLRDNSLIGTIPSEIGRATKLQHLRLSNNTLTGTIPSEINELTNLNSLYLYGNNFTPPFACPDFIEGCYISCDDWPAGFDGNCRNL